MTPARIVILAGIAAVFIAGAMHFMEGGGNLNRILASGIQKCEELDRRDQQPCWQKLAATVLKKFSFQETQQVLRATGQYCHEFMHALSRKEYEHTRDAAQLFSQCTLACYGACYHGGAEGYLKAIFEKGADEDEVHRAILTLCNTMSPDTPGALRSECIHGIGHALMFVSGGDLPKSLTFCDTLPDIENVICYGGAFMENLPNLTAREHPPRFIKADDPFYPCNDSIIKDHQKERCYSFHGSYFIYLSGGDWKKASSLCLRVPKEYQGGCFWYLGISATRATPVSPSGTDQERNEKLVRLMWNSCTNVPEGAARTQCIKGIMWSFGIRYGDDRPRIRVMLDVCPLVAEEYRMACYQTMGSVLVYFIPDKNSRENICGAIAEPAGREICLSSTQASFRDVAKRMLQ